MTDNVQPLNPIAFELGPISVHWYGMIIACGVMDSHTGSQSFWLE